jgi:hypothetical protein
MNTYEEILAFLKSDSDISRSQIVEWMKSDDLKVLGALYTVTDRAYYRIKPDLGMNTTCDFVLHYYTRCIVENPQAGDYLYSRYQAGLIMSKWIKHLWGKRPQTEKVLEKVRDTLAKVYLRGDQEIQWSIIYIVLEHVLEDKDMIVLFKSWKKKPHLREAYDAALDSEKKRLQEIPASELQNFLGKGNV